MARPRSLPDVVADLPADICATDEDKIGMICAYLVTRRFRGASSTFERYAARYAELSEYGDRDVFNTADELDLFCRRYPIVTTDVLLALFIEYVQSIEAVNGTDEAPPYDDVVVFLTSWATTHELVPLTDEEMEAAAHDAAENEANGEPPFEATEPTPEPEKKPAKRTRGKKHDPVQEVVEELDEEYAADAKPSPIAPAAAEEPAPTKRGRSKAAVAEPAGKAHKDLPGQQTLPGMSDAAPAATKADKVVKLPFKVGDAIVYNAKGKQILGTVESVTTEVVSFVDENGEPWSSISVKNIKLAPKSKKTAAPLPPPPTPTKEIELSADIKVLSKYVKILETGKFPRGVTVDTLEPIKKLVDGVTYRAAIEIDDDKKPYLDVYAYTKNPKTKKSDVVGSAEPADNMAGPFEFTALDEFVSVTIVES